MFLHSENIAFKPSHFQILSPFVVHGYEFVLDLPQKRL
jgi:hypothetical protein